MEPSIPQVPDRSGIAAGSMFSYEFSLCQKDLDDFIALSGDSNIIHRDQAAALHSPIGSMAVPGMLSALIFSRVLGTMFPGHGTVYRSQSLKFLAPMYLEKRYEARFVVLKIELPAPPDPNNLSTDHSKPAKVPIPRATITTNIFDMKTGNLCLEGVATVFHKERLIPD
jgi:hypothetical protein